MKQTLLLCLATLFVASSAADAAPKRKSPAPIEPPNDASPAAPRVLEYSGDDVSVVLRSLARQARMNLVIDNRISGNVNMRLEDKTPRQAIDTIVATHDLILDEKGGVFYIRLKNPPPDPAPAAKQTSLADAIAEAYGPAFGGALMKLHDAMLDHQARPETAQRLAKAKKALYDALIAEGFTKDEAFRLVLADQGTAVPPLNQ